MSIIYSSFQMQPVGFVVVAGVVAFKTSLQPVGMHSKTSATSATSATTCFQFFSRARLEPGPGEVSDVDMPDVELRLDVGVGVLL